MKSISTLLRPAALSLAALCLTAGLALPQQPAEDATSQKGVEPATYGPVHEAFAEPVNFDAQPGLIVATKPPDPIEEVPPAEKPAGENVVWIPGYWGWDDVRESFVWISGLWRDVPPGRQWIPGYWTQVEQGWQWVSGYWADTATQQVTYLPPPPDSLEAGPSSPAPSDNSIWAPGTWMWEDNRYAWQPGYWLEANPNWVWVPAHYVWAPGGCIFVAGYWDLPVERRGLLFAPVFLEPAVYRRPGFVFTPSLTVNLSLLTENLFVQPRYYHYCFGNYYAAGFVRLGIYPSFAYHLSHYGYDPIFAHRRWVHRRDAQWEEHLRTDYALRRDNVALRPPRTFAAQQTLVRQAAGGVVRVGGRSVNARNLELVHPLSHVVSTARVGTHVTHFEHLSPARREQLVHHVQNFRQTVQERARVETKVATHGLVREPVREARPVRVGAVRTPVVSAPIHQLRPAVRPPAPPHIVNRTTVTNRNTQVNINQHNHTIVRPRPEERLPPHHK
jgi:hypothetical protein